MNVNSEQVDGCLNIVTDQDQPLKPKEMYNTIIKVLGNDCTIECFGTNRYYLKYKPFKGKPIAMLVKAVTYLGNPHPIFKKRIQLSPWWNEFIESYDEVYDIRFIGVYHYKGMVIFSDFNIEQYKYRSLNNSSAHVYTNDLFQAISYGVFRKIDQNDNLINTVSIRHFKNYLNGVLPVEYQERQRIFNVFKVFNDSFFEFDVEITAKRAITEMKEGQWVKWREAEWGGFFLEYKIVQYLDKHDYKMIVRYVQNKNNDDLPDLDLYFPTSKFYGDLKSSDIENRQIMGNDKETIMSCLNKDGRVWYVVYEHETVNDSEVEGNPMTRFWNEQLGKEDPLSYVSKMKHSVTYRKMSIYEINRANYGTILKDFNQGHQPDGKPRNVKISIKKKEADNFVVYRYSRGCY